MLGEIDLNARPQKPQLFLCLPNKTTIAKLTEAYDIKQSLKLGGVNELSFAIPFDIDKQHELTRNPHVDMLKARYLIKFVLGNQTEWYRLEKPADGMDDSGNIKRVTCYSLAIELKDKQIRSYKKDAINAATALSDALSASIWNTDYIDVDYLLTYRSFDVSKASVLDFVLQVATTFNALVIFNTVDRTVNFYKPGNIGTNKGLKVSYGKYLKSLNRESDAGQIVTRLKVFGKDGISIQSVNPSGANYVEDFSYFMYPFQRDANRNVIAHSLYMSDELCHALMDYSALLTTKEGDYAPLLSQHSSLVDIKTTKENELATLNTELANIQAQIDLEQSMGHPVTTLLSQQSTKQSQINTKQVEISSVNSQIASVDGQIATLQSSVSMTANFTSDQIKELNQFIVEGEWSDDNYFKEVDLYAEAKKKIQEFKQPPLVINVDIVNFKEIVTEQRNWDKLNLGDSMTITYEKFNLNALAKIIEMNFEYDSASVSVVIADVKEILNDQQKYLKMLYSSVQTTANVDMNKFKWNGIDGLNDDVSQLLNNSWDAAKRAINAGVDNTVTIDRRGITISDPNDPLGFLRATAGCLGISSDGGNTFHSAILKDRIVADLLAGKILAGNNLFMTNEAGTFTFDKDGATIKDADLTITRSDGKTRILASPNSGFSIQKLQDTTWTDKLYADFDGNLQVEDLIASKIKIKDADDKIVFDAETKTADFTGFSQVLMSGNVNITGNINMTGGSISWSKVNAPSASQVGAKPYDWLPDWNVLKGITPVANPNGAAGTLERMMTYIDGNGIYTGTLTANQINAVEINAESIKTGTLSGITINVDTDITVGRNIIIGDISDISEKKITFNGWSSIYTLGGGESLRMQASANAYINGGAITLQSNTDINLNCTNLKLNGGAIVAEAVFG